MFSFIVWVCLLFYHFDILHYDLAISDQLLSPHFFVSFLILIYAWAFSGPMIAALLSVLSVFMLFYLTLATKEPSYFIQILFYCFLFIVVVSFLYEVQKKLNNRRLVREKAMEDIRQSRKDTLKKDEIKIALNNKIDRFINLHHFSEILRDVHEVQDVADKIILEMKEAFPVADEWALYLVDENRERLSLAASSRIGGEIIKEKEGSIFDQWVMKRSRAIVIEDSTTDFRFGIEKEEGAGFLRSLSASPLMSENKVLGVLRVSSSKPLMFNSEDLRLLDIIADLGAGILRTRILYRKMEELAIQDSLTGLYLYRYFRGRLDEEIRRSQMNRKPFSLMLLDIDFFKHYNDEYGHSAGDIVLKNIAATIHGCVSPVDLVARYGGEEFIVLLPNKDQAEAMKSAEKIRAAVEDNRFYLKRIESKVTVSIGVVSYPEAGFTKEEIVRAADSNLYEAKRLGRNRVCGSS